MNNFKVGDRISVYTQTLHEKGYIADINAHGILLINIDCPQALSPQRRLAHPKQCRRLVKKERRSIWIPESTLEFISEENPGIPAYTISLTQVFKDDVQFIEVRKKK